MGKLQYCATDQTAAHAQKKCVNRYNALRVSGKFFTNDTYEGSIKTDTSTKRQTWGRLQERWSTVEST